jgi:hypothetical protein
MEQEEERKREGEGGWHTWRRAGWRGDGMNEGRVEDREEGRGEGRAAWVWREEGRGGSKVWTV